jgi:hypothetical protein
LLTEDLEEILTEKRIQIFKNFDRNGEVYLKKSASEDTIKNHPAIELLKTKKL